MNTKDQLAEIAQNPKVATVVSAATAGTGAGTALDWIPTDIGKLATLIGIVLSVVLTMVHVKIYQKTKLEISIMAQKEKERRDAHQRRIAEGHPTRRHSDLEPAS